MNFAGHASRPRTVIQAVERALSYLVYPERMGNEDILGAGERVRGAIAELLGAHADDVGLTTGASCGIAATALGLDWSPGDEVVYSRTDFPAHHASWQPIADRLGILLRSVDSRGVWPTTDEVIGTIGKRTRVVSLSHVRFDDGAALDGSAVADACRLNGSLLLLDVSQSCGAIPLNVASLGADIIVCAGYKYLLGPWGAGFIWLSRRAQEMLRPLPVSWIAQGAAQFDQLQYVAPRLVQTSARLDTAEAATITNLNLSAFGAAIDTVLALRVDSISAHLSALTEQLLRETEGHVDWISPRNADGRGPFVCFGGRSPDHIRAVYARLRERHVTVALRNDRIRVSPHMIHTADDMSFLAELLIKEY